MGFYELFLRKCQYIEKELSICENRRCLRKLHEIFQLNNNNVRTPPELIEKVLIILAHVRNACAHKSISLVENNNVNIKDRNPSTGEFTFNETRKIPQLWEYFHAILTLDRGLCTIALVIMLKRRVESETQKHTKLVQCSDCKSIEFYFLPPQFNLFLCKQCKIPQELFFLFYRLYFS